LGQQEVSQLCLHFWKEEKALWCDIRQTGWMGGLSWCLLPMGNLGQRWHCRLEESFQNRNQSWNGNPGLFCLKITRDLIRAF
jgi:hypothetical protein